MNPETSTHFDPLKQVQSSVSSQTDSIQNVKKSGNKKAILTLIVLLVVAFLFISVLRMILEPLSEPEHEKSACGYEAKICPSGDVSEKGGPKCEFSKCPDTKIDISNIWEVKATSDFNRAYTNFRLNFSFEAPKDWEFKGVENGFKLTSPNYTLRDDGFSAKRTGLEVELSTQEIDPQIQNIEVWLTSGHPEQINPSKYPDQKIINIAGTDAVQYLSQDHDTFVKKYAFLHNGVVYYLVFYTYDNNSRADIQPIIDQIFSTFKFIQ